MGLRPSRYYDETVRNRDITPDYREPPTHDPLFGFPNGRKERVMLASREELEKGNVELEYQDYCGHMYMDLLRCRNAHAPFYSYYCNGYKHDYEHCQYDDFVLRLKEYEREKRLNIRDRKIRQLKEQGINVQED